MARKRRESKDRVFQIKKQLKRLLNSPLTELAEALRNILNIVETGVVHENGKKQVIDYIIRVLDRLPTEFGDRFYFDSAIIQSVAQTWSQGAISCSGMIVPTDGDNWGHEKIPIQYGGV